MKVSIIMPFHKGVHFLEDALESLKDQSFKDFELLLICDQVKEDIDIYVNEYGKDFNIVVAQLKDKTGVAAARNLGLSMAKGQYIYFLDSDDYLDAYALEHLVSTADVDGADVVYGKKTWTWFQRSLFLRKLYEEEDEDENEEDDEEGEGDKDSDSSESDQDSSDGDGRTEIDNSISDDGDDDRDNKQNGDKDDSQEYLSEEEYIESKQRYAYYELFSRRRSVRSITVLHVLMRRELIEDNNIRFNEDIIFLSDYPFLLQILDKAHAFSRNMDSLYVKRNHNDTINFPSLGQTKGSKSFVEYVKTSEYAKTLIAPESDLRRRLDKKIIYFTIRYFAPKLKRAKNVELVIEQFYILHGLISKMDKELIRSYKKYKKRILRAFFKGNYKKAKRIVTAHLARRKIKRLFKNKRELPKFLYRKFFLKTSVKENWVLCESFFSKNYSDNPKYIYEYLQKNYPGKYKFIWVIENKHTNIPYKHIKVKRFSIRYCYYFARCKYNVFNCRQPVWIKKRQGNVLDRKSVV